MEALKLKLNREREEKINIKNANKLKTYLLSLKTSPISVQTPRLIESAKDQSPIKHNHCQI